MQYFIFYSASNIFGAIIFSIMLAHDLLGVDRQEKQIKYDRVLVAFMLYFISDAFWAGVDSGVFPVNIYTAALTNFTNYIIMSLIMYTWLDFVMAVEQSPHRNRPINKFAVLFPFVVATVMLIATFLAAPKILIGPDLKPTAVYTMFLVGVPYIYIIAVILYTIKKALHEENPIFRRKHIFLGILPILAVVGGVIQMLVIPELTLFCFASTILMLLFYLQSLDRQISTDPLTGLNNRGQIMHYASQPGNLRLEGRPTYVVMMDINNFKKINDTYGHEEGDRALVITAQALIDVVKECSFPVFLGRYGGDEFILIVNPSREDQLVDMMSEIHIRLGEKCKEDARSYDLSISIGYDELVGEQDTFQKCLQRADNKLYIEKEHNRITKTL